MNQFDIEPSAYGWLTWTWTAIAVFIVGVLVSVVVNERIRRRRNEGAGLLYILGLNAMIAISAAVVLTLVLEAIHRGAQTTRSVQDAVYETYDLRLTDEQARELKWPVGWPVGKSPAELNVGPYGSTVITDGTREVTVQLAWTGAEFQLRTISEKDLLPGTPYSG